MAYNIPNGFFNAWLPLCSINFRSLGVDEVGGAVNRFYANY